ncbi:MAG: DUF1697 domain-containing protein [Bacteroidia bacterium]
MPVFLSILRGINVSGQKKILMSDLKLLYEELDFKKVQTFIQSGNVIFESKSSKLLADKIEQKIKQKYAFDVPVIIRTMDEMEKIIKNNPFIKTKGIETDKLHITYLSKPTTAENIKKTKQYTFEPDAFEIIEEQVYIYCPNGYGRTKLTNTFFEKKLNVSATTRNWKTSNELLTIMKSY